MTIGLNLQTEVAGVGVVHTTHKLSYTIDDAVWQGARTA